ncbi:hypothetical protein IFM89_019695 [Coptis chinensis]|uniref:DUF7787 domain-containing protein n=1 Tax=Coptis chinensis TaxID=261450 RepID=A0A835GX50_9MAGN|nr:hypothetical protein IFM89_019695 [Coptis chinensis]
MGMKKSGRATLESYIKFLNNPNSTNLTKDQLNEIISMHGFRKLHHSTKKDIIESMSVLDLISPNRTTLKENISSSAFITQEKLLEDLISLSWNECSVQSIETIGLNINSQGNYLITDSSAVSQNEGGGKLKLSKKRRALKEIGNIRRTNNRSENSCADDVSFWRESL